ncbi:MAG: OmpA family protein [Alphaproteobacteria bacterium]|nr:OmpA family protein [Alphaproteobacteria bacterium]
MKSFSSYGRYLVLLAVGLMIAGCSGWSYSPPLRGNFYSYHITLPNAQGTPASGSPFTQALAHDYADFAGALINKEGIRDDSDYFARKSLAAGRGEVVPPENVGNWSIVTPWNATEGYPQILNAARARLVRVLDAGARERQPQLAARVQVDFDCWVEHMEKSWWTAMTGPCHNEFFAGLAQLEGKPVMSEYRVYFEFDKYNLTPEALQTLQQVTARAKADPRMRILLVGHADAAGTDAYNMGLSHRRADAVRGQLQRDGVLRNRVDERWVGKRQPLVPTPDGVREPRNRVVVITLH